MKSFKKLALPVLFLAASVTSFSQSRTVTVEDAVRIAIENNRDVEIARLNVQRADASAAEQYGNIYPTLNITGGYTRYLLLPVFLSSKRKRIFRPNLARCHRRVIWICKIWKK